MVLDVELANMWKRTLPRLVYEVSGILRGKVAGGARVDGWDELLEKERAEVRYDVWGREVSSASGARGGERGKGWLDGWLGSAVAAGGGGGGEAGKGDAGKDAEVQNVGLLAAIQRSLHWARQRIVGSA